MFSIDKVIIDDTFKKPTLCDIDIDIRNFKPGDISKLDPFNYVIGKEYDKLTEYVKNEYVIMNVYNQTPLMLAAYLNDANSVKILISEAGKCDVYGLSAYMLTTDNECKSILKEYEDV